MTDHRINLTLYSLDDILSGGVDAVIEPLLAEYQADQLAALGTDDCHRQPVAQRAVA